jgi:UDP-glucose 4-epimerase
MKNVLMTGGAGFIGSHLTEALLARGDRVTVVDDESTGAKANLKNALASDRCRFLKGSIGDPALLHQAIEGVDQVYHLAAAVGVALIAKTPLETIERNIQPTQLLLDELRNRFTRDRRPVRVFIASTSEVYGKNPKATWSEDDDLVFGATTKPRWSYGVSKAIDEFLALACARQYGMPVVVGRFFNVVGPRQSGAYGMVLPRFVEAALQNRPLTIHDDGKQTRCFAHVADVVRAVVTLVETTSSFGRVFNIGSDQPISILDLAKRTIALAGSSSTIEFQSYREAYDADFEDIRHRVPDLSRIREAIAYERQYDLDATIVDAINWRKANMPA